MARDRCMAMAMEPRHPTTMAFMATPTPLLVTVGSRMPCLTMAMDTASVMDSVMATTAGPIMPITGTAETLGAIATGAALAGPAEVGVASEGMGTAMVAFLAEGDSAVMAIDKTYRKTQSLGKSPPPWDNHRL